MTDTNELKQELAGFREITQLKHDQMQNSMNKLEETVKEGFKTIGAKIEKQYDIFATKEDHKRNENAIIDINSRTATLEKSYWKFLGILSILVPTATFILTIIYEMLFKK